MVVVTGIGLFRVAPAISFLLPKTNSIEKRGGGA
jgi:hypothetical protein